MPDLNPLHNFNFSFNRELSEIYISVMIRTLAISLIAIFIPIFLYADLGYPISKVVLFIILVFSSFLFFTPMSAKLTTKIGFKHNILLSSIFYIGCFIMLNFISSKEIFFYLSPILLGLGNALYWLSFHIDFAKYSKKKTRGQQIAFWYILAGSVAVIGPFLAGLILKFFPFSVLFIIGSIILLTSTIPLFFSRDQHIKSNFTYKYIFKKENFKEAIRFGTAGAKYTTVGWIWPLFIFIILAEYFKFGLVMAVLGIFSLIAYGIIGKLSDGRSLTRLIKIGAVIEAVSAFSMGFAKSIASIFAISAANKTGINLIDIPMTKRSYETSKKKNLVEYLAFREITINIGRLLLLLIFFLFLNLFTLENHAFIAIFVLSGLTSIFFFIHFK